MSRKHKGPTGQVPRSQSSQTGAPEQKRSVSGDVHVRGEVTIETSPEETRARKSEIKRQDARETKRWRLEVLSFIVLTCYAALTFWQSLSSQRSANAAKSAAETAKQTLNSTNRSWLEMRLASQWDEDNPDPDALSRILQNLTQVTVPYEITNIGHVPVKRIYAEIAVELLNRDEAPHLDYKGRYRTLDASILYPTRTLYENAVLYGPGSPPPDRDLPPLDISPLLRQQLSSGEKYIAAYAKGTFTDNLGDHWFHFCRWIAFGAVKSRFGYNSYPCVNYNDTGDSPAPTH